MNLFLTKNYPLRYKNYLPLPNRTSGSVHKKIGASSHSMKFLSPEVVAYLYRSTILTCMECNSHVWASDI